MNKTTKIILFSAIALLTAGMALYPAAKKSFQQRKNAIGSCRSGKTCRRRKRRSVEY